MGHPTVEVTLLFTDIEGSTALAHELGDAYVDLLAQHNRIIRDAIGHYAGVEARNEGDAFFAAFDRATDAVAAAAEAQRALARHPWVHGRPVRVRMGLHTGPVIRLLHDFAGLNVHLASRIAAAAHGGQVVASESVLDDVPDGAFSWIGLGAHIVKDFPDPITLYQLSAPNLAATFPPLNTIDARDHNLPARLTSFVGRADELADVRTLLSGDARLITLTGPGGVGKTRIAIEAAWSVLSRYRGGVWFVDFAPVADPDTVVDTITNIVGARDRDQLVARLSEEPTLLVLDNLEHLLPGVVAVSDLLKECPKLEVLVTTRERLRLQGEHEVVLDGLAPTEAVELFCERAALVRRDFVADDHVETLCARVAGLPLAIELAAARLRTHSTEQLVAAMDDMLSTLSEGERDRPARHQAMRAAIAFSVDALTEAERGVFRSFAVFGGGATSDAVTAVCAPKADEIESLVDKSLLRASDDRVTMLEPIRQFAEERLRGDVPGEFAQRVDAHARYFLKLAERLEPELITARQADALDELSADHANLRRAWERAGGDIPLRIAANLTRFWAYRGNPHEGRAVLGKLIAEHPDAPVAVRATALLGAGHLATLQNDSAAAVPMLEQVVALGDVRTAAAAHNQLGDVARQLGDFDTATAEYDAAMAMAVAANDTRLISVIDINRGAVAFHRGDYDIAADLFRAALSISEARADSLTTVRALNNLGLTLGRLGHTGFAVDAFERSLAAARSSGDRAQEAVALLNLAAAFDDDGPTDPAAAAEHAAYVRTAIAIFDELGFRRELASSLLSLCRFVDAPDECRRVTLRARGIFAELGDEAGVARAEAQLRFLAETANG